MQNIQPNQNDELFAAIVKGEYKMRKCLYNLLTQNIKYPECISTKKLNYDRGYNFNIRKKRFTRT
jgi:hypothetical protein